MFELGQSVIDTKKKVPATVVAILDGVGELYVIEEDGSDVDCYIVRGTRLIPYDKDWLEQRKTHLPAFYAGRCLQNAGIL